MNSHCEPTTLCSNSIHFHEIYFGLGRLTVSFIHSFTITWHMQHCFDFIFTLGETLNDASGNYPGLIMINWLFGNSMTVSCFCALILIFFVRDLRWTEFAETEKADHTHPTIYYYSFVSLFRCHAKWCKFVVVLFHLFSGEYVKVYINLDV